MLQLRDTHVNTIAPNVCSETDTVRGAEYDKEQNAAESLQLERFYAGNNDDEYDDDDFLDPIYDMRSPQEDDDASW
jgi:hypothetical protein